MLTNHVYNLIEQIATEQKSLWRMKKMYDDDAGDCDECKNLWERLRKQKETDITSLVNILREHLKDVDEGE